MVGVLTMLSVVVVSQMCACVETHHTVHFTRTQCVSQEGQGNQVEVRQAWKSGTKQNKVYGWDERAERRDWKGLPWDHLLSCILEKYVISLLYAPSLIPLIICN